MGCGIYAFLVFLGKGRTIRKVMGGGGVVHFQPVRLFFQNFSGHKHFFNKKLFSLLKVQNTFSLTNSA